MAESSAARSRVRLDTFRAADVVRLPDECPRSWRRNRAMARQDDGIKRFSGRWVLCEVSADHPVETRMNPGCLAETEGFEPSMRVFARMLP